jgi:lysophospholipase L1-like esterase
MKHLFLIIRFLLGLLVFAVVLELCARVDDVLSYRAPFWGPYNYQVLFIRDRTGKWGRPGVRYEKWQLNSLGYRGPDLRPGTVRIACFGASETFGLYEAEGQEYPRQLERELNTRFSRDVFQVVNVAYAGETVSTATLRIPKVIDEIHPSFAVIYPAVAEYIWLPWLKEEPISSASDASYLGRVHLSFQMRLTERLRRLLKQITPPAVQTKLREIEIEKEVAKNHYDVMERIPEENIQRFRTDLLKFVAMSRAQGVEPVLVTHATAFGNQISASERSLLTSWRVFYPMLREEGFLDMEQRMNDAIRQTANHEHVPLIDAAAEIPPCRYYFADFVHFTSAGAAEMASRLADGFQALIDTDLKQRSFAAPRQLDSLKALQEAALSHRSSECSVR